MYIVRWDKERTRRLFTAGCASYVEHPEHGLLWLEMRGPIQACRAIWGFLVKSSRKQSVYVIETVELIEGRTTHPVRIAPWGGTYKSIVIKNDDPMKEGLLMFRREFDHTRGDYLLGGTRGIPSPWFARSFSNLIDVPMLPAWPPILWEAAIDAELLEHYPPTVGDIAIWHMTGEQEDWQALATDLVQKGILKHG